MIVLEWLMRDFADVTSTPTPNTLVLTGQIQNKC